MYFQFGRQLLVGSLLVNSKDYEMGYTPKEFKKTLQGLFITQTSYSCREYTPNHWQITAEDNIAIADIKIKEAPPRVIALLTLPVLDVLFEFKTTNQSQQNEFIKNFFRYFHKGGG